MSTHSSTRFLSCLEKWRNAVADTWQQRAAGQVVERERIENNMVVRQEMGVAERRLARLQLIAGSRGAEHEQEVFHEVRGFSSQGEPAPTAGVVFGSCISFPAGNHPESTYKEPMRRGTPAPLPATPIGYVADDEKEAPPALRIKTRCSRSSSDVPLAHLTASAQTPEPLQGRAAYRLRSLKLSEVWDEDAPASPILFAPVPRRPFREPELLLVGYHSDKGAHDGPEPTSGIADSAYNVTKEESMGRSSSLGRTVEDRGQAA